MFVTIDGVGDLSLLPLATDPVAFCKELEELGGPAGARC
jgi:hypothetical protein